MWKFSYDADPVKRQHHSLVLGLLLAASPCLGAPRARAEPALGDGPPLPWGLSIYGGVVADQLGQDRPGILGVSISRLLWRHLELEAALRLHPGKLRTQLDLGALAAFNWRMGLFGLSAGVAAGVAAIRADHDTDGSLWVEALLLKPRIELRFAPWSYFELRLNVLTVTAYYNRFWLLALEPTCGVIYRF
jgi:hypothetical protein